MLLLIVLNVGVIQSLGAMDFIWTCHRNGPCDRDDTYSMIDECDIKAEIFVPLSNDDTLSLFLFRHSEEEIKNNWPKMKSKITPMLGQAWKTANNGWIEAPIVYAAKKGLFTFLTYIFKRAELERDQAILDQALHGAVLYDHPGIAMLLLESGANPNGYRLKKSYCLTTLEAAFVDLYGCVKKNIPDPDFLRKLISYGAYSKEVPQSDFKESWKQYVLQNPDLKKLYENMRLFKTSKPSLKHACISHFVHNDFSDDSQIPHIPGDLLQEIMDARQLYRSDSLLNLDNHN